MSILFSIKHLNCSYYNNGQNNDVLNINDITIPKSKLVMVLGQSGSGKSTLLEALGLMRNTLSKSSELKLHLNSQHPLSLNKLWQQSKTADIRNNYYSFIFQTANFMPNFSIQENILLPSLIQGSSIKQGKNYSKQLLSNLFKAEEEKIDVNLKASQLSGGQRQRIAFVRALSCDFEILFGDEPTGNLDELNSKLLIKCLKDELQKRNASAIIVTHNISLALEYADTIMLITKNENVGTINQKDIYKKESSTWSNFKEIGISNEKLKTIIINSIL